MASLTTLACFTKHLENTGTIIVFLMFITKNFRHPRRGGATLPQSTPGHLLSQLQILGSSVLRTMDSSLSVFCWVRSLYRKVSRNPKPAEIGWQHINSLTKSRVMFRN